MSTLIRPTLQFSCNVYTILCGKSLQFPPTQTCKSTNDTQTHTHHHTHVLHHARPHLYTCPYMELHDNVTVTLLAQPVSATLTALVEGRTAALLTVGFLSSSTASLSCPATVRQRSLKVKASYMTRVTLSSSSAKLSELKLPLSWPSPFHHHHYGDLPQLKNLPHNPLRTLAQTLQHSPMPSQPIPTEKGGEGRRWRRRVGRGNGGGGESGDKERYREGR